MITKASKGGVHHQRQVVAFIRDKDMAHKLFDEIGPRYEDRPGGYTAHPQAGPPPRRQRADGPHRVRLAPCRCPAVRVERGESGPMSESTTLRRIERFGCG